MTKGWIDDVLKENWTPFKFRWDIDIDDILGWLSFGNLEFWQRINNCFKIPYEKILEILFVFGKEMNQPFSDVLGLAWYDIEMMWQIYSDYVNEQNEQNTMQNERHQQEMAEMRSSMPTAASMSNMMRSQQNSIKMPSMPSLGNFKL